MLSKVILASGELGCSEEILTVAAVLSVQVSSSPVLMISHIAVTNGI